MKIKKELRKILKNEPNTLRYEVALEGLAYSSNDEIKDFFLDLIQHGCISGMIGKLIYYADTHKFYDKYYNEIEELRLYVEDNLGNSLELNGDYKNAMAWYAFEETAIKTAFELDIFK